MNIMPSTIPKDFDKYFFNRKQDIAKINAYISMLVSGAAWCALAPGLADPAVIVPCALALFAGALLTVLEVRATILEALTLTVPALVAGVAGGILTAMGFFGPGSRNRSGTTRQIGYHRRKNLPIGSISGK